MFRLDTSLELSYSCHRKILQGMVPVGLFRFFGKYIHLDTKCKIPNFRQARKILADKGWEIDWQKDKNDPRCMASKSKKMISRKN